MKVSFVTARGISRAFREAVDAASDGDMEDRERYEGFVLMILMKACRNNPAWVDTLLSVGNIQAAGDTSQLEVRLFHRITTLIHKELE